MFNAELSKVRYLPLPRFAALGVLAVAVAVGTGMIVATPNDPTTYVGVPATTLDTVLLIAALVFGVWLAALEHSAGTLQRTLTAEPDRNRVLLTKVIVAVSGAAVVGAAAAVATGGLTQLAINRGHVDVGAGELARNIFAVVPDGVSGALIGFGFGLLTRSIGGGVTASLAFVFVLSGALSFIPTLTRYSYSQASADLNTGISGGHDSVHSPGVGLLIMAIWAAVIVVPGWLLFLREDTK